MRALVTAFIAGFVLVLLYERVFIGVKEEIIQEELEKEMKEERVAPLQEVIGSGMDIPAPRDLPARTSEDESYPQRRTAEVKAGLGAAITSISAGISRTLEETAQDMKAAVDTGGAAVAAAMSLDNPH